MADSNPTDFMTTQEAVALADNLAQFGGKHSVATRLATMETQCRKASPGLSGRCCGRSIAATCSDCRRKKNDRPCGVGQLPASGFLPPAPRHGIWIAKRCNRASRCHVPRITQAPHDERVIAQKKGRRCGGTAKRRHGQHRGNVRAFGSYGRWQRHGRRFAISRAPGSGTRANAAGRFRPGSPKRVEMPAPGRHHRAAPVQAADASTRQ